MAAGAATLLYCLMDTKLPLRALRNGIKSNDLNSMSTTWCYVLNSYMVPLSSISMLPLFAILCVLVTHACCIMRPEIREHATKCAQHRCMVIVAVVLHEISLLSVQT